MPKKTKLTGMIEKGIESDLVAFPNSNSSRLVDKVEKTKAKQKSYSLDLRIHSPSSLGYLGIEGLDTAPALVRLAKVKGLDIIAVTDFFSGAYIDRVIQAAQGTALKVIPGVDLRCRIGHCDDVVISCLFPETFTKADIESVLTDLSVPKSAAGNKDYIVSLDFGEVLRIIESKGGVAIPSRMDRTPIRMRVMTVLVEEYGFRAFNLAYEDSRAYFKTKWPKTKFQLFTFSNANALAQVGSRIEKVKMGDDGFEGVRELAARV